MGDTVYFTSKLHQHTIIDYMPIGDSNVNIPKQLSLAQYKNSSIARQLLANVQHETNGKSVCENINTKEKHDTNRSYPPHSETRTVLTQERSIRLRQHTLDYFLSCNQKETIRNNESNKGGKIFERTNKKMLVHHKNLKNNTTTSMNNTVTISDDSKPGKTSRNKKNSHPPNMAFGCQNFKMQKLVSTTNKATQEINSTNDNTHRNTGHIPIKKEEDHLRCLYCNPNGFNTFKTIKVHKLFKYCTEMNIDTICMAETATKWTSREIYRLKQQANKLTTQAKVYTSDSKAHSNSPSNYLPGGTASIFLALGSQLISTDPYIDKLGRWQAVTLTVKDVSLLLITDYRIPTASNPGLKTSATQYNVALGEYITKSRHREDFLLNLAAYI